MTARVKPTLKQIEAGTYIWRDGQYLKKCTGPAHEEPEYLPATEKYYHFHKSGKDKGKPVARCRLCINWSKIKSPGSYHGLVPVSVAHRFFVEAVNRVGVVELSRRTGISTKTILKVLQGGEGAIYKKIMRTLMLELTSMQRKNENNISEGSRWRQERRLNGAKRCAGCGGPINNLTIDCSTCLERHRGWHRAGKITNEEWANIQKRYKDKNVHPANRQFV